MHHIGTFQDAPETDRETNQRQQCADVYGRVTGGRRCTHTKSTHPGLALFVGILARIEIDQRQHHQRQDHRRAVLIESQTENDPDGQDNHRGNDGIRHQGAKLRQRFTECPRSRARLPVALGFTDNHREQGGRHNKHPETPAVHFGGGHFLVQRRHNHDQQTGIKNHPQAAGHGRGSQR